MRRSWGSWVISGLIAATPATVLAADIRPAPGLVEQLAHHYTTPEALAAFLRQAITFRYDRALFGVEDYWQSPEELLIRRRGDCEDYALLAQAVLRVNGIRAEVLSVFGAGGYAHTVCVFADATGRYNIINQDRLFYVRAPSLEAAASALHAGWTFAVIGERHGTRGRVIRAVTPLS